MHNTEPWQLEVHGLTAALFELPQVHLSAHDPTGRDRLISCGAALTNLAVAVRALGWTADLTLYPDADRPDLVGVVTGGTRTPVTAAELARAEAIFRRHSHRRRFQPAPVAPAVLHAVTQAAATPGVEVRRISGETEIRELAECFEYSGRVLRHERGYQSELAAWTVGPGERGPGSRGQGIPASAMSADSLPFAGFVRPDTPQPDSRVLAERIGTETILAVVTEDDTRRDQVQAGIVAEQLWLAALTEGLAASVLTQPLLLVEVRARLRDALGVAGSPQLLLRLGRPVSDEGRRRRRLPTER